jgi:hypothetical protein
MGRREIEIDKEELREQLQIQPTQQHIADHFGVSQATICNRISDYELIKTNGITQRDEKIEFPSLSWKMVEDLLLNIQDTNSPTVGYDKVEIEIESPGNILIVPIMDTHFGSRYTYSRELLFLIDLIVKNPRVFTGFNGDLADNYNTSAYKAGQIEQTIPIQRQKAMVEALIKKLQGNILWFVNGCHDEWSYFNDGFDLAQYLAHKDQEGYYMGHHGRVDMYLNEIKYRAFVTHNTFNNSQLNKGHGLKWVCREEVGFDIGIKAHDHVANIEEFVMRGKNRYSMCGSSWKGQDRHGSKSGFPPSGKTTPGFILNAHEKQILLDIDYRNLVKYL